MDPRKKIYNEIRDRILLSDVGVKTVKAYRGQDKDSSIALIALPAVLLRFPAVDFKSESNDDGIQQGDFSVELIVIRRESGDDTDDDIFDLPHALYLKLQGVEGREFDKLNRKSVGEPIFSDGYIIDTVLFESVAYDDSVFEERESFYSLVSDVDVDLIEEGE